VLFPYAQFPGLHAGEANAQNGRRSGFLLANLGQADGISRQGATAEPLLFVHRSQRRRQPEFGKIDA
jgi:hypothetical protein